MGAVHWHGSIILGALLIPAAACGSGSSAESSSGDTGSSATDTVDEASDTMVADSTAAPTGSSGPVTLEQCMEETAIALDCSPTSRLQYIIYGDVYGCGGLGGSSEAIARFTFSLEEVVDTVPQIRSIRVVNSHGGGETLFEASAPDPVPLTELQPELSGWTGDLLSFPPGILELEGGEASVSLDAVPTYEQLSDMELVSGTFEVVGGALTSLASPVDDPGVRAVGCFMAPSQIHAIESD